MVGIDIGKETHYARAFDNRGIEQSKLLRFSNTSQAMFLRYGKESVQLADGKNQLSFPYEKDKLLYLGSTLDCKSIGNSYRIEAYL